jgi:hypothetical protein
LENFEKITHARGYQESDPETPKEFLGLYEKALLDSVRDWKTDVEEDQQLPRLFVFIDRWRGFAYSQYLSEDSTSMTFYQRTFGDDNSFLSPQLKKKFLDQWKTIAMPLSANPIPITPVCFASFCSNPLLSLCDCNS